MGGHTGRVLSVAFGGQTGHRLASASQDRVVVWNTADGTMKVAIESPAIPSWPVAFSPDGATLATGAKRVASVHLWNPETGVLVNKVGYHDSPLYAFAFSPDGRTLATSDRACLRFWDVASGALLREVKAKPWYSHAIRPGWPVAYSGDGSRLIFPNQGHPHATIVRTVDGLVHKVLHGRHTKVVQEVAFSQDSRFVATAGDDRTARIWNAETGEHLHLLDEHTMPVRALAFSPVGPVLATGSSDWSVRLWDVFTGKEIAKIGGAHKGEVCDLAYSADGRFIASGGADGIVRLWNADISTDL